MRGKALKDLFDITVFSPKKLSGNKLKLFPNIDENINMNSFDLIIHDMKIQKEYWNEKSMLLIENNKCVVSHGINTVILPYPEGFSENFKDIKKEKIFIGLISRPVKEEELQKVKEKYYSEKPIILVTGSCGYFQTGDFLLEYALKNYDSKKYQIIFVYGEYYREKDRHKDVTYVEFEKNLHALISISSAVVCNGGYNTLAECAMAGVETICFPRKNSLENYTVDIFTKYFGFIKMIKGCAM
jgi:predicted glycosyltransferase